MSKTTLIRCRAGRGTLKFCNLVHLLPEITFQVKSRLIQAHAHFSFELRRNLWKPVKQIKGFFVIALIWVPVRNNCITQFFRIMTHTHCIVLMPLQLSHFGHPFRCCLSHTSCNKNRKRSFAFVSENYGTNLVHKKAFYLQCSTGYGRKRHNSESLLAKPAASCITKPRQ